MCDMASSKSKFLSARIAASVDERLTTRSEGAHLNKSRLAERYIDEGLRMDEHPGIVFRDGPVGRRAALASGPDVWEVMSVVKNLRGRSAAISQASRALDLTPDQVRMAVRYYSEFPDEIDERIRRNQREAAAAEAAWKREQAALG